MRASMLFVALLALSACGDGEKIVIIQPEPSKTVVVPAQEPPDVVVQEEAKVICPDGSTAAFSDGVYRC